ncbi:MAG: YceI family protein [Acidobacteriaceae bacterium]
MRRFLATVAVASVLVGAAFAADEYKIDPNHSSANFSIKHLGVSMVHGRFSQVSGVITLDEANPANSKVVADIKTESLSTDNAQRDKHLKSPDFFDVEKYPDIKFESTKIEKRGDQWVAVGNLTMKDETKQVELPFDYSKGKMGLKEVVGVNAATHVNRMEYHVDWNKAPGMVGDDVKIEINLEAGKPQPQAAAASK